MPAGYSGSYGVNGIKLTLQPSQGVWEGLDIIGFDGDGRPIYPSVGEFTLSWGLMSTSELKQINDIYLSVSNTGTVVTELPKWGDTDYLYYAYSGTIVDRPTVGEYFMGYVTNVALVIGKIRA